jgi:hypothetical protein
MHSSEPISHREKLRIVLRALAHDMPISELARGERVPESCIEEWQAKFVRAGSEALAAGAGAADSREGAAFADLQAVFGENLEWLRQR